MNAIGLMVLAKRMDLMVGWRPRCGGEFLDCRRVRQDSSRVGLSQASTLPSNESTTKLTDVQNISGTGHQRIMNECGFLISTVRE